MSREIEACACQPDKCLQSDLYMEFAKLHLLYFSAYFLITSFVPKRSNKKGARFVKARETVAFLLALSGSRHTNRLRLLGRYRMARISQSASLCELASWMRPQKSLAKNALP